MTNTADRTREQRLRRAARRQGFILKKSPRRDRRAFDYGMWYVLPGDRSPVESGGGEFRNLDAVERYLCSWDR